MLSFNISIGNLNVNSISGIRAFNWSFLKSPNGIKMHIRRPKRMFLVSRFDVTRHQHVSRKINTRHSLRKFAIRFLNTEGWPAKELQREKVLLRDPKFS